MIFTCIYFFGIHVKVISHEFQIITFGDFACVLLKLLLRLSMVCHYVGEILMISCKFIKPHAIS